MRAAADRRSAVTLAVAGAALSLTACGGLSSGRTAAHTSASLPQGAETVRLDPADFTVDVTNTYWPMRPGDRWVYEETDEQGAVQRVEVTVLDRIRTVAAGIDARVVHDQVTTADGAVAEDTLDYYAQDAAGNVWYLGEETTEYANGQASTEGSWEAGVDHAQPGILLPADPQPGSGYRQEYLEGEAEDEGFVLSTDEKVQVPTGTYTRVLLTRDTTALEPDVVELKWYAPGVGPVLELAVSGEQSRAQLVEAPAR